MTTSSPVPSDVEPDTIIDLVHDCREVSGVLGSFVPTVVRIPEARTPQDVEIGDLAVAALDGWGEYGS